MALWHIPLRLEEDPFQSVLGDIFDWTFPPSRRILRYRPYLGPKRVEQRCIPKRKGDMESRGKKDEFRVSMNVKNFQTDEIALNVDGDNLKVTGKHHKETDYGFESAEFERRYPIPADVDPKSFASKLNDDGVLEIIASKVKPPASKETQQNEENFKLTFDVSDYKPDEITVKLQGNELSIRGEQKSNREGDKDSFFHYRQFSRRLLLPNTIKLDSLQSKLTKEGKLVIEAEKMAVVEPAVRQLEIEQETELGQDEVTVDESRERDSVKMDE